jgi:hypothetical protein
MKRESRTVPPHGDGEDGNAVFVGPLDYLLDFFGAAGIGDGGGDEFFLFEYGHRIVRVWVCVG